MVSSCSGVTKYVISLLLQMLVTDGRDLKLEHMVVVFDHEQKNAKLSLRQEEILAKLSSIVDGISADCPEKLALVLDVAARSYAPAASPYPLFTQSMVGIC